MKLTTKTRNALPSSAFAGPGRTYPITNRSHAANAKARASAAFDAGKMSASTHARIFAKANAMLNRK
jgi:hypothetical protein